MIKVEKQTFSITTDVNWYNPPGKKFGKMQQKSEESPLPLLQLFVF